jgi:hypothetical protein
MKVRSGTRAKLTDRRPAHDSTVDVLPGESCAEFEEVRKSLIAEFAPDGALEMDCVSDLANLLWRKQNLIASREAARAREHARQAAQQEVSGRWLLTP